MGSPQAATRPSAVSASECSLPADTATTFVKPGGTFACPEKFSPHAATEPSSNKARLNRKPAPIAVQRPRLAGRFRSEERRVGKECRPWWLAEHYRGKSK